MDLIVYAQNAINSVNKLIFEYSARATPQQIAYSLEYARSHDIQDDSWLPGVLLYQKLEFARKFKGILNPMKVSFDDVEHISALAKILEVPYSEYAYFYVGASDKDLKQINIHNVI